MADEKLKEGDTVMIKSGGPIMTLDELLSKTAKCVWFDSFEVKFAIFGQQALKKVDPKDYA